MKAPWKAGAYPASDRADAPSPSGAAAIYRVRTKTGSSSIRGRISSPIPVPDPSDDDFPIRSFPLHQTESIPEVQPEQHRVAAYHLPMDLYLDKPQEAARQSSHSGSVMAGSQPSTEPRATSTRRVTERTSLVRDSAITSETTQSGSSRGRHRRQKSSLRGALSKLFGRKRNKSGSSDETNSSRRQTGAELNDHRRSDLTHETVPPQENEAKRSISLPITEYDRALRSHSIGPDDVLAIEYARNSLNAEFGLSLRRARTLTGNSSAHPSSVRWTADSRLTGLSPRPASCRNTENNTTDSEDPNEIGRAITSDIRATRRRSRSLSGLPHLETRGTKRRRSDEIRYWRESYDPTFASPISPSNGEDENTSAVDSSKTQAATKDSPKAAVQPFALANIASMNQIVGLKITEAAGLDARLDGSDARRSRLEGFATKPYGATPRSSLRFPSNGESGPTQIWNDRDAEKENSVLGSPKYSNTPRVILGDIPKMSSRPASTATVKSGTKPPFARKDTSDAPVTLTMDHYTTLIALIETERSSRMALEVQIRQLSHQISLLTKAPMSSRTTYGEASAFDVDDEEEEDERAHIGKRTESARESTSYEDSGIVTGSVDDEASEAFVTPQEEEEALGGLGDDQDDVTLNARALSLSQLTLSGGSHTATFQAPVEVIR